MRNAFVLLNIMSWRRRERDADHAQQVHACRTFSARYDIVAVDEVRHRRLRRASRNLTILFAKRRSVPRVLITWSRKTQERDIFLKIAATRARAAVPDSGPHRTGRLTKAQFV